MPTITRLPRSSSCWMSHSWPTCSGCQRPGSSTPFDFSNRCANWSTNSETLLPSSPLESSVRWAHSGVSNGSVIPVKLEISPLRAFAYSPFASRSSQTSRDVETCAITALSGRMSSIFRRTSSYGVMKEHNTGVCLEIILAMRATPSKWRSRPSRLKSVLEKKSRMVSPSSTSQPKRSAAAKAMVVLPAPESPVSQTTRLSITAT